VAEFQFLAAGSSEAQNKLASSFLFAQSSVGVARTGILSGLSVTQTPTASGSVHVGAGAATVQASLTAGVSLLVNDTTKTLNVFTSNPVGAIARYDIVVFDSATKTIRTIVGTPNANPVDPTIPATVVALARLRHPANATTIVNGSIDDLRAYTRLAPAAVNRGGEWMQARSDVVSTGALGEATINFPDPFTTLVKSVVVSVESFGTIGAAQNYEFNPTSLTSFKVLVRNLDGTPAIGATARVSWIAQGV
jgi:hypothetical protein